MRDGRILVLKSIDRLVESLKMLFFVIPAKAGIKRLQAVTNSLDSGFRRSDDFLRVHTVFRRALVAGGTKSS
jgi:hypothetical protein